MADLLSQDDLNALWGLSSGDGAGEKTGVEAEETGSVGVSQADLDALWGALAPDKEPARPRIVSEEPTSSIGDNLSQDDIDRLLENFAK